MNKPTGTPDAPRAVDAGMEARAEAVRIGAECHKHTCDPMIAAMLISGGFDAGASFAAERTAALKSRVDELERLLDKVNSEWLPMHDAIAGKAESLSDEAAALQRENAELKAKLAIYADRSNWRCEDSTHVFGHGDERCSWVRFTKPGERHGYDIARAALTDAKGCECSGHPHRGEFECRVMDCGCCYIANR